jgi:hypothetical protein
MNLRSKQDKKSRKRDIKEYIQYSIQQQFVESIACITFSLLPHCSSVAAVKDSNAVLVRFDPLSFRDCGLSTPFHYKYRRILSLVVKLNGSGVT